MVAFKMNEQPVKAPPTENRHRDRPAPGHGLVRNTVTPTDDGLPPWRALRVLIVDDEQELTGGLFARVEAWGHAPRRAYHGRASLIMAAGENPDVVLLNLELGSMGGRHLASQLRLDAPPTDCLIIAVADWADDERRRRCREAGIDLLLITPLDPSVLEVLLWLECVHTNRQQATDAATRQDFLGRIGANHAYRNA